MPNKRFSPPVPERVLDILVQPRASRNEIAGYRNGLLQVRVTAPPVEGEANLLVREIIAEALGIPPSRVEILRGQKGRRKRVRVQEVPPGNLERLEGRQEHGECR